MDFYCPTERIAIELDDPIHDSPGAKTYDRFRDEVLGSLGIQVLRFSNGEVEENVERVLGMIRSQFGRCGGPPRPAGTLLE